MDERWGARLEACTECDDVVYARGEAARAYDPELALRQFTREVMFLGGDAVVLRDTIRADAPHRYEWLLQMDGPPAREGGRCFSLESGETDCRLHALQPDDFCHRVYEQEITANPTSAKPDWIISSTQYALALSPPEPVCDCNFFIIMDLAGFAIESRQAERGLLASLVQDERHWLVGFATGKDGILAEGLNVDGRWFAGRRSGGEWDLALAGDVTSIWLDGALQFAADRPVDVAMQRTAAGTVANVSAPDGAWIRVKGKPPGSLSPDGRNGRLRYDALTGMAWAQAPAGKSELVLG